MRKMMTTAALAMPMLALGVSSAAAQSPRAAAEGDWVSVSGTVNRADDNNFWLDYDGGLIKVEVGNFFTDYNLENRLEKGERVTVYGAIDDQWFAGKVIDADRVYIENRSTWFDLAPTPGTTADYYLYEPAPALADARAKVSFNGTVENVSGRSFTLDTGASNITVDTAPMTSNPLDASGWPQVSKGDHVLVSGRIDNNLFDKRVLRADNIYSVQASASPSRTAGVAATPATTASAMRSDVNQPGGADTMATPDRKEKMYEPMRSSAADDAAGAKNPVFLAIDKNRNGEISRTEYVTFTSRMANISKSEADRYFETVAEGDDRITPNELFFDSAETNGLTDMNR